MKIAAISIADYVESTEGMPHDVERLYFRMLLKMYSREGGLPDDDRENARMFGSRRAHLQDAESQAAGLAERGVRGGRMAQEPAR